MTMYNSQRVNNDPNTALTGFRDDLKYYEGARDAACAWLDSWDDIVEYWGGERKLKPSEAEHAYKVLSKLVNVYGEE